MNEQENNPYYMKSLDSSSKKLQSSTVNSANKLSLNGRSNSAGKNHGDDNIVTELQSPLEIPGLFFL